MRERKGPGVQSRVCVRGEWLELSTTGDAHPTSFSMFLANMVNVKERHEVAIDAGAGSGILSLTLAKAGVRTVLAVERSSKACSLIRSNADLNGCQKCIDVLNHDIRSWPFHGGADLIVSNPPTVPDFIGSPGFLSGSGPDGLEFLTALLAGSARWLRPSGGELQVIVSSLIGFDVFESLCSSMGFQPTVMGTMPLPVRSFYYDAYGFESISKFVRSGQLTSEMSCRRAELSEVMAVYQCVRGYKQEDAR